MFRESRFASALFVTSALCLIAYPVLRPANPEEGLTGAGGFASPYWLASHSLAMLGFLTLALALRQLATTSDVARSGETRAWLATAFLLPYYGAEAFALNVAGQHALDAHDPGITTAVMSFRYAPLAMVTFAIGLCLLAMVSGWLFRLFWSRGTAGRLGALFAGLGLLSYLPQYFLPMPGRIAHGVVLGVGLVLIAVTGGSPRQLTSAAESYAGRA